MQVPGLIVAPLAAALTGALLLVLPAGATEEIAPGDRLPPLEAPVEIPPGPEGDAAGQGGALPGGGAATGPETDAATGPGTDSATPGGRDAAEAAQAAHLDALFAELADPANPNWERTQAQIYAVWAQSGSDSMDLLAMRADKAMEAQDLDTALTFLDDLVRLAPGFAEGWNKRATVYFLRDQYGSSLKDIARTLAIEPRHFGAYAGLGIILDRLGDKKGALEAYRRAAELHPHLPGAAEGIRKLTREVEGERT